MHSHETTACLVHPRSLIRAHHRRLTEELESHRGPLVEDGLDLGAAVFCDPSLYDIGSHGKQVIWVLWARVSDRPRRVNDLHHGPCHREHVTRMRSVGGLAPHPSKS